MKAWQGFERLGEKIMQDLRPDAAVQWNDSVYGHDSDSMRQIDVSVRWTDTGQEYLLIVDTKNWNHPVDVPDVGSFSAIVRDVRASGGILVCNSGFTAGAQKYAANIGIGLCNLHDAESKDWSRELTVPLIWAELTPTFDVAVRTYLEAGDAVETYSGFPFCLSPDDGMSVVTPATTIARMWNAGELPRQINMRHSLNDERELKMRVTTSSGETAWRQAGKLDLSYTVQAASWLGQFQPSQCRGLIDYLDQRAFIVSYLPLSELPSQRDESWTSVQDPAEVALSIRGTVVTTERAVFIDANTGSRSEVRFRYLGPDDDGEGS